MLWLLGILLAVCEETGAPIYTETRAPIGDPAGGREEIVVFGNGAWRSGSWDAEREGPGDAGCLTKHRLAEVKRALKRARFEHADGGLCDAVSTTTVTYEGRRGQISTEVPCGPAIDRGTARAAACVAAAIDASVTVKRLRAICRQR